VPKLLMEADAWPSLVQASKVNLDSCGSEKAATDLPSANGELLILLPRSRYLLIALMNRDPRMASDMAEFLRQSLPQPSM
jgi:hypothetical protein